MTWAKDFMDTDDEPKGLTPGKELEEALLCVSARDYIPLLDGIREDPKNCRAFATLIARSCPQFFEKYAKHILGLDKWSEVDQKLREGSYIPAIKEYRVATGAGLKEAKTAVDKRKKALGL